jgi:hypothetical protein
MCVDIVSFASSAAAAVLEPVAAIVRIGEGEKEWRCDQFFIFQAGAGPPPKKQL